MYIVYKKIDCFFKKTAIITLALSVVSSFAYGTPKEAYVDKYAAIVMDANTGTTLFQVNASARRYPASLTKMMTLYMLFEAMQSGRVSPNTPIPISAYAASRPPTKIGFKVGQTIPAEAAAKALITKSANDVAAAIGEYLGGSEPRFAQMMSTKARRLGMMNTNFANASGLPNVKNYSTARDLAILSLSLRAHFPKQYNLFKTTSFVFRGQTINGHNRLVKNMTGVDGIKTGYTNMSGFNLATSMRLDGKSIVAVVLGGKTAGLRDAHMSELLRRYLPQASRLKTNKSLIAATQYDLPKVNEVPIPIAKADIPTKQDDTNSVVTAFVDDKPADISATAANQIIVPIPGPKNKLVDDIDPIVTTSATRETATTYKASAAPGSWAVQIGSLPSQQQANDMIDKAKQVAKNALTTSKPSTEVFQKGKQHYYRARFIGFSTKKAASQACTALKKANFNCYEILQ